MSAFLSWPTAPESPVAARSNIDLEPPEVADRAGGDAAIMVSPQSGLPLAFAGACPVLAPSRRSEALKRGLDLGLAGLALVWLAPLLLLLGLLVALDSPGPVLFRQERVGRHGRRFRMWKFRSMRIDSCDPSGLRQTVPQDGRLTRFGRLLRRYNFDELPQLVNVLMGDMSLVGPRPHVPDMRAAGMDYRELVPYYELRHSVAPGLTGWAQVNGLRGPSADPALARRRIDHDLAYIQNRSLRLDLRILALTCCKQFGPASGL